MARRSLILSRPVLACGVLLAAASAATAQLPTTELHSMFPPGGKVGTTFNVRTTGANQDDAWKLMFLHPGITAEIKKAAVNDEFLPEPLPQAGHFQVTIAGDVPPGLYEAWVVGRFGISNPKTFAVGTRDEWIDDGSNRQPASAKEIPVGYTINGQADANVVDYFAVTLKQGQRILVECLGQRIDSRINATLAISDEQGTELVRDLDTDGYDPLLDFTAPADGKYLIAVWDFYFDGGTDYFYRLHVHEDPRIDFVFPPAGTAGSSGQFTVYGRNLPQGKPAASVTVNGHTLEAITADIALPAETPRLDVVKYLEPQSVGLDAVPYTLPATRPVMVGIATSPITLESEPNNDFLAPQTLSVPCEVAGQFFPERDIDVYQFDARKGETFIIEVISHRLGLDTDPFLSIDRLTKDGAGKITVAAGVAQVDDSQNRNNLIGGVFDTSTDDPSYRFVAPEDATYRVIVTDQFGDSRNDARMVYRLAIRPEAPDYRLYAVPEDIKVANNNQIPFHSLVLRRGGTALLKVSAERLDGFSGDIALSAQDLPAGVSCAGGILTPQQTTVWLVFEAAEDAAEWAGPIRILGRAATDQEELQREARAGSIIWGTGNNQQTRPEYRVVRQLTLSVTSEMAPALVRVGETKMYETSLGGSLNLPIQLTRRNDFNEAVKLVASNVPNEVKPGDVDIAGDKSEGALTIAITNAKAVPGTYTFYLRSDTKVKYSRNPELVTRTEQQRDQLNEIANQLNEQVKTLTEQKDAAVKTATDAAANAKTTAEAKTAADKAVEQAAEALKQAEAKLAEARKAAEAHADDQAAQDAVAAAEKELTAAGEAKKSADEDAAKATQSASEAQTAQQSAEEAKTKAEQALKDSQDKAKRATDAKTALDKRVEEVKKANNPADVNIALVSTPIQLRIVSTPIKLAAAQAEVQVKKKDKAELLLQLERLYGFAEAVELTLEAPKDAAGLAAEKLSVAADQSEGRLQVTAAENTPVGKHAVVIRAKAQFNKVNVEATIPATIEVVE
jgi:hypothetical protein